MTKNTFPAPKWFQELFAEMESLREESMDKLAKKTGYAKYWCKQNPHKAFQYLKARKDIDEVLYVLDKLNIVKDYMWGKYRYHNFDVLLKGWGNESLPVLQYNKKKKTISFVRKNAFGKIIDKARQAFKKLENVL